MATKARLTPELVVALFTEALTLEFGIRLPVEAAYHDRARTMISADSESGSRADLEHSRRQRRFDLLQVPSSLRGISH